METIRCVARERKELVSFDVFKALAARAESTHDLRALGPMMSRAASDGIIQKTGRYAPNPNRHGSMSPVWRSLIYVGEYQILTEPKETRCS